MRVLILPALRVQALGGWCLGYCRDQDSRASTHAAAAPSAMSTRLDTDAGPPQDQQHQVRGLFWRPLWCLPNSSPDTCTVSSNARYGGGRLMHDRD
jgi:hypothetical protein